MTLITNAPRLPGDQEFAPLVAVELLNDAREPVVGYVSGSGEAIHHRLAFAANGQHSLSESLSTWAVDLVPNVNIEPAGTVYRITEQRGRALAAIHIVEVPALGGPYTVLETLIDEPGSMGSLLLDHLADTIDAHDASSVSVIAAGSLAATDAQSALVELDAQDTAEALARAAADTAEATTRAAADTTLTTNLAAHGIDTTGIHGIADTAALVVTTDLRLTDTRTPPDGSVTGGVGAGAKIAANTIVDANVAPAAAIAQSKVAGLTTALSDEATARSAAVTAEATTRAAADTTLTTNLAAEVTNRAAAVTAEATARANGDTTEAAARSAADTAEALARTTHEADTTAVHGIADTTALVLTNDARLTDTRTPTDNSVTQAKVPAGALGIDRLAVDPRARGTHTGTQLAGTISDLATAVQATRLDQFAAPTAPVNFNGQRLANGALPTAATDVITKEYADALRAGLLLKADPVRIMIATNVNINAPGAVLDSIAMAVDDRVLLTGQTSANDNGIYLWKGAAAAMVRATDANTSEEMRSGAAVWVSAGTYQDQRWAIITADPITLGVTAQVWSFDGGLAHVTAGAGLTKTGNQIDVGAGIGINVAGDTVGIAAAGVGTTELADLAVTDAKVAPGVAQAKITGLVAGLAALSAADTTEANARAAADALLIPLTQKAAANGVATLDAATKIPAAQVPDTYMQRTIVDAKGDIIAATAADTLARLPAGANDSVLTADSAAATGLKWAVGGGYSTTIHVEDYGTVDPTGVVSSQAAFAAALAAGAGKRVTYKPGTYLITSTLVPPADCWFDGPGQRAGFLKAAATIALSTAVVTLANARSTISNHGFIGASRGPAISMTGAVDCLARDCRSDAAFTWGVFCATGGLRSGILRCHIEGTSSSHGIEVNGLHVDCFIQDCTIRAPSATLDGNCIELFQNGVGGWAKGTRIIGNALLDAPQGFGILAAGDVDTIISGNVIRGNNKGGIRNDDGVGGFATNAGNAAITGNTVIANGGAGIVLNTAASTVSGNVVALNGTFGIAASFYGNQTITGNMVRANGNHGIFLNTAHGSTIVGNTCINNSTAGGSSHGIHIEGAANVRLVGNRCTDTRPVKLQYFGISLAPSCSACTVMGNSCAGNLNAEINDDSTTPTKFGNSDIRFGGTGVYNSVRGFFTPSDSIVLKGNAGALADNAFTDNPPDGTMAIDTTNSKIYVRIGGVWKSSVALT